MKPFLERDFSLPRTRSRIDLSKYRVLFDYLDRTNPRNLDALLQWLGTEDGYRCYVDDKAATWSSSVRPDLIGCTENFSLDILISRGFREVGSLTLQSDSRHLAELNETSTILVPCCQTRDILASRVSSTIDLTSCLQNPVKVVLSGGRPIEGPVNIEIECVSALNLFVDYARQKLAKDWRSRIEIVCDPESTSTADNIFYLQRHLPNHDPAHRLYIVSSNYQLPKIATQIEGHPARHVILCGADHVLSGIPDFNTNPWWLASAKYIKSLFFEALMTPEAQELLQQEASTRAMEWSRRNSEAEQSVMRN